ncbi:MAG: adenylate kinase [Bacteroidales bacterium]
MRYFIVFGPPGAGKGTQSYLIAERFNFLHISTGEMLRAQIKLGSEVGKEAKELIDKGKFVSDNTILKMVREHLTTNYKRTKAFVFDGFPRTLNQAAEFDKILLEMEAEAKVVVISLEVDDALVVERIKKRGEIEGRRDDAYESVVKTRIKTYHNKTEPLIEYYKRKGVYYPIAGEGSVEEVFESISKLIDRLDRDE